MYFNLIYMTSITLPFHYLGPYLTCPVDRVYCCIIIRDIDNFYVPAAVLWLVQGEC